MRAAHFVIITAGAVTGLWWGAERNVSARLRIQLGALQWQGDELARLRQENERLLRNPELQAGFNRITPPVGSAPNAGVRTTPQSLQPGKWAPASAWTNCGRGTPESAVETMLWAAAGGDLEQLKSTLDFDDASRARAEAILARLPEAARRQYATPSDLLALMVAGSVPLESAQVVARQMLSEDEATEYVRLKSPDGTTRQVGLTLQRSLEGWKLRVPPDVVDQMTRDSPK